MRASWSPGILLTINPSNVWLFTMNGSLPNKTLLYILYCMSEAHNLETNKYHV